MKAITILEPWASLIAYGVKKIETRSWSTNYRGKIAIHAGKSKKNTGGVINEFKGIKLPDDFIPLNYGCVIAIADLVDCVQIKTLLMLHQSPKTHTATLANNQKISGNEYILGDYTLGRYAWILKNVQRIEPIPTRGQQRIWNWSGNYADYNG